MKTIIAGSRCIDDYEEFKRALGTCPWSITEVVSGSATGVDLMGERFAKTFGFPLHLYPVTPQEWRTLGKKAGPLRNAKMAENAEACFVMWDGVSRGTRNMIDEAKKRGLKLHVVITNNAGALDHIEPQ